MGFGIDNSLGMAKLSTRWILLAASLFQLEAAENLGILSPTTAIVLKKPVDRPDFSYFELEMYLNNYLGRKVKDKVTGYTGVVTTIGFDLFGCIQCTVNPGVNKEGKLDGSVWMDLNRLEILDPQPVMELPNFEYGPIAEAKPGPAEKPASDRF